MKILIVAYADTKNPLAEQYPELASIASGKQPTILQGMVTKIALERALDAGQFEVVHVIGHGNNKSFQLADGPVTAAWFIRRLRAQRGLKLVFLNACDSVEMGAEIHTVLHVIVIAQKPNVNDAAGAAFATDFYGAMDRGATHHDAFFEARAAYDDLYPDELRPIMMNGNDIEQTEFQSIMIADTKLLASNMRDTQLTLQSIITKVGELSAKVLISDMDSLASQLADNQLFHRTERRFTIALIILTMATVALAAMIIWHEVKGGS